MNLLILRANEDPKGQAIRLDDYRAKHINAVLKLAIGDSITLGKINGLIGKGRIAEKGKDYVCIDNITLDQTPPTQLNADVILALPRPRMLQRSLQTMATMGVKHIHLIHTERVEKSFWQTPLLTPSTIEEHLILGLEQAKATQIPSITCYKSWREVKDKLSPLLLHKQKIIAHPGNYENATTLPDQTIDTAIAIGPEGGFTQSEVDFFISSGFAPKKLGSRILRVETAIPVLLGKLFD